MMALQECVLPERCGAASDKTLRTSAHDLIMRSALTNSSNLVWLVHLIVLYHTCTLRTCVPRVDGGTLRVRRWIAALLEPLQRADMIQATAEARNHSDQIVVYHIVWAIFRQS